MRKGPSKTAILDGRFLCWPSKMKDQKIECGKKDLLHKGTFIGQIFAYP